MKPIRAIRNQYYGMNAHLHSLWQNIGNWNSFHVNHLADLARAMQFQLRPLGYVADIEQSLQIRRPGDPVRGARSDITIFDPNAVRSRMPPPAYPADARELVLEIPAMIDFGDPEEQYGAIAVYQLPFGSRERGEPVAWIELLSPSNKPGHSDFAAYDDKRWHLLRSGIVFIELDYLHQSPPTFERVPIYPDQSGAHPYHISVVDPRPDYWEGFGRVRQFDVDESIPTIPIPLNDKDVLTFDFDKPYQKTIEAMFYGDDVDYTQLPTHFESYSPDDQRRIAARMVTIIQAEQQNIDLETGPIALANLSLEDALKQIESWQSQSS
jgi:hypothetical protein